MYDPSQAETEIRELRTALDQMRRELAIERDITERQHHVLQLVGEPLSVANAHLYNEVMIDYRNTRTTNDI